MQSLSKLVTLVILVVIFFALVTQRMMLDKDNLSFSSDFLSNLLNSHDDAGKGQKLAPRIKPVSTRSKENKKHTKFINDTQEHRPTDYQHRNQNQSLLLTGKTITPKITSTKVATSTASTTTIQSNRQHSIQTVNQSIDLAHSNHMKDQNKNIQLPKDSVLEIVPYHIAQNRQKVYQNIIHSIQPVENFQKNPEILHYDYSKTRHQVMNHTLVSKSQQKSSSSQQSQQHHKKKHALTRLHEPTRYNYHPNKSPRSGTDISSQHHSTLLRCPNQTKCIIPELQLKVKFKVYFCKKPVRSGARFYYLVHEGLLNHPNVELVSFSEIDLADLIIYLPASAPWHLTECTNSSYAGKLVVLEEFDGHTAFIPYRTIEEAIAVYGKELNWYLTYFKRSFVTRLDGVFMNYPHLQRPNFYPLVYSLAEMYISETFVMQREIDIVCTLRGHKGMRTRLRTQEWIQGYNNRSIEQGKPLNVILGQADTGTRVDVSKLYFQNMYNTKIIVTVNPSEWEGDFRLWESLASGALVFCDPVFVPHEFPLQHGKHLIYFNNKDKNDLWSKLDYYLANPMEARRIAVTGYLFAMKYHRTVNMMDYILRSTHMKLSEEYPEKYGRLDSHTYQYIGQYLHRETMKQQKVIKQNNYPGNYTTGYL